MKKKAPKRAAKKAARPLDRFDPAAYARSEGAVLGLGRSGVAVARLLASKGFRVLASDTRPHKDVRPVAAKLGPRVKWEAAGHSDRLLRCAFAVKSPGLAPSAPILGKLREAGVPVFSELEVSLAFCRPAELVAVTGTNGKTTTTMLAGALFAAARRKVHVAGNIGVPLAAAVSKVRKGDVIVLEASSYQLEDSRHFHPTAGALLNVTADHLDHHGSMAAYLAAKSRLFRLQTPADVCVFNAGDALSAQLARACPARRLFFGLHAAASTHAWVEGGKLVVRLPGGKPQAFEPPALPGSHNLENAMAAALLALARGLPAKAVQKGLKGFTGVEHRIEDCGVVGGIRCVNDSKATNVESTIVALKAFSGDAPAASASPRVLLILGGLHKGFPYAPLKAFLGKPIKGILTIGSAARKIEEDLGGHLPILPCETLEEAVRTGLKIGERGDVLLLSPACASFDQFDDFEHRGRRFKELVSQAAR
ncbi:MAG: UDP-N-acetylmuramoyl-L-alanine--D-glutamate ligase [Elusimicrobia bacterium]|nr:UDP-N-acetylmuramoyl-L-alanine--D-glutamate ligase [Elusimicrobiota bacterium]